MAPPQSSVLGNQSKWVAWRNAMPNVKFFPWIVCDDPVVDAANAKEILANYPSDGLVINAEKSYEGAGKWKASVLCPALPPEIPKFLSPPSSPAEIFDMDYRTFEKHGFIFGPQAYWNEFPDATPYVLWKSMYLPSQLHVGRDYRLQISGVALKHWGRIVQWDGNAEALVKDLVTTKLHRVPVKHNVDKDYHYMTIHAERKIYNYKTGKASGKLLGFQAKDKILPTVGIYEYQGQLSVTSADVLTQLDKIPMLKGASIYLGEYPWSSDYIRAAWESIQ